MKIKNAIIYLIVSIIIFSSFEIPQILIDKISKKIESEIYLQDKNETKIDVEAEKIYLVSAIHNIEKSNTVEVAGNGDKWYLVDNVIDSTSKTIYEKINKELSNLKEYNILNSSKITNIQNYSIGIIKKSYRMDKEKYTINSAELIIDKSTEYKIELEEKTGKIISIDFEKDKLYETSSMKGILELYIKYLDLYIIDDWQYEEDIINKQYIYKSNKADLKAILVEKANRFLLSIHTGNITSVN